MKEPHFKPGDEVVFTGPYLFNGEPAGGHYFDLDLVYTVLNHSAYQDQYDRHAAQGFINVLLNTGRSQRWVDQDCLALAAPTDDEIAALFGTKPVVTDREFLERLTRHKWIPADVRKEIREHLGL